MDTINDNTKIKFTKKLNSIKILQASILLRKEYFLEIFYKLYKDTVLYRYKHIVCASEKCFGDSIDICAYIDL